MKTLPHESFGVIGVSALFGYVMYWFVTYAIPIITKI